MEGAVVIGRSDQIQTGADAGNVFIIEEEEESGFLSYILSMLKRYFLPSKMFVLVFSAAYLIAKQFGRLPNLFVYCFLCFYYMEKVFSLSGAIFRNITMLLHRYNINKNIHRNLQFMLRNSA